VQPVLQLPPDARFNVLLVGQQTGLRIDRVLFKPFQQLCALEKLRPGGKRGLVGTD